MSSHLNLDPSVLPNPNCGLGGGLSSNQHLSQHRTESSRPYLPMLLLFMVSTEVGAGKYTFYVPKCVTGICPYTNAQLYFILESLLSNRSRLITKDITTSNKSANLPCYTSLPLQPWAAPWGNQSWVITLRCSGNKHPRETTFVSCQYNCYPSNQLSI